VANFELLGQCFPFGFDSPRVCQLQFVDCYQLLDSYLIRRTKYPCS
jgi:hypothetical protein